MTDEAGIIESKKDLERRRKVKQVYCDVCGYDRPALELQLTDSIGTENALTWTLSPEITTPVSIRGLAGSGRATRTDA